VLEEAKDTEEIIKRVAALDIGKAQLTCCSTTPATRNWPSTTAWVYPRHHRGLAMTRLRTL
jgi:hypothetical protein